MAYHYKEMPQPGSATLPRGVEFMPMTPGAVPFGKKNKFGLPYEFRVTKMQDDQLQVLTHPLYRQKRLGGGHLTITAQEDMASCNVARLTNFRFYGAGYYGDASQLEGLVIKYRRTVGRHLLRVMKLLTTTLSNYGEGGPHLLLCTKSSDENMLVGTLLRLGWQAAGIGMGKHGTYAFTALAYNAHPYDAVKHDLSKDWLGPGGPWPASSKTPNSKCLFQKEEP